MSVLPDHLHRDHPETDTRGPGVPIHSNALTSDRKGA